MPADAPSLADVQETLLSWFIAADGAGLRAEDHRKATEVHGLLGELARLNPSGHLVDAAAGKAYVGLLAARFLGWHEVTFIERDARRAAFCAEMTDRLPGCRVHVQQAEVSDPSAWPPHAEAVVALHACGPAADTILDRCLALRPRWLLLVPCCTSAAVPFAARATAHADALGLPRHAEVRRRFLQALVDAERTLRLEAGGYEVTVVPFVAPTVTPHNLLWRARWSGEGRRQAEARTRWERLVR